MTGPLSALGLAWDDLADRVTDWQVDLLRRTAREMAAGYDQQAQRDVEGASEWRDLSVRRGQR